MKTLRHLIRPLLLSVLIGGLSISCNNGTSDGATPTTDCRIQRIVSMSKSAVVAETIYTYDAAGNLLKATETQTTLFASGGGSSAVNTNAYTYNSAGFLTAQAYTSGQKLTDGAGKVTTYPYTWTKTFTYANNRLTGYARNDVSTQGTASGTTGTYEYDAAGQLVKEITGYGSGSQAVTTYQSGKVLDYVQQYGGTESRPFTYQDGLVVKARFPGSNSAGESLTLTQAFQYDGQRRLVKHEELLNDAPKSSFTQAWQPGKPGTLAVPTFKGHPDLSAAFGEPAVLTKKRMYDVNPIKPGVAYLYADYTFTNQVNVQGYITSMQVETTYPANGQPQPAPTLTTYTYTGCK